MEEITTQMQFAVFVELIRGVTENTYTFLYYSGIFLGLIVFPVYGVILIRRIVRRKMETLLSEIAEWDPWMWSIVRGGSIFESGQPLVWLEKLVTWYDRYKGGRIFLGMPDLNATALQLTSALANVFMARFTEIRELPPAVRNKLDELVSNLHRSTNAPELDKLIAMMQESGDQTASLFGMRSQAADITSWPQLTAAMGLAGNDISPASAALDTALRQEKLPLALFVFARREHGIPELAEFIRYAHDRSGNALKRDAANVDKLLRMHGQLIRDLKNLITEDNAALRFAGTNEWKQFRLAFGISPFEALEATPGDSFRTLRHKYSIAMLKHHPDLPDTRNTDETAKITTLAWEVITSLKRRKLID